MKTPVLDKLVERTLEQVELIALRGDLDDFIKECDALTTTNCGWQQFYIAKTTKDYAKYLKAIQEAQNG
jgi:hypothetical protein